MKKISKCPICGKVTFLLYLTDEYIFFSNCNCFSYEKPSDVDLEKIYDIINYYYFANKLPDVKKVDLRWVKTLNGKYGRCFKGIGKGNDRIEIAEDVHSFQIQNIPDTLVHEMIHLIHPSDSEHPNQHTLGFIEELKRINSMGLTVSMKGKLPKFPYVCSQCGHIKYTKKPLSPSILEKIVCNNCGGKFEKS